MAGTKPLSPKAHRRRHWELHQALDEVAADFILHHRNKRPGNTTLLEVMQWSAHQLTEPDEFDEDGESYSGMERTPLHCWFSRRFVWDGAEGKRHNRDGEFYKFDPHCPYCRVRYWLTGSTNHARNP